MNGYGDYWSGIVPIEDERSMPPVGRIPIYDPWTILISQGIEAAKQAAINIEGRPQYPQYPIPAPPPILYPTPDTTQRPRGEGIQLSQTTLMLIVGGVLLFMLGGRRR